MQTEIIRRYSGTIERPLEEVRAQFHDMRYHVAQNVHPDLTFTIHDTTDAGCSFSQAISLAGMRQVDEIVNSRLPNGDLRSDFVSGMNAGGALTVHFQESGVSSTLVSAELRIPVRGAKIALVPVLGAAAGAALAKAFAQDKRDLEAGNYTRYRERATATST